MDRYQSVFIGIDIFFRANPLALIATHLFESSFLFSILLFQNKKKYELARVIFTFMGFFVFFMFSVVVAKGQMLEYFYLLPLAFSVLLSDNKVLHYVSLVLSLFFISALPFVLKLYSGEVLASFAITPVLILSLFGLIKFFKRLFINSEKELIVQKEKAEQDNKLILAQKEELEHLHKYQNQFFVNIAHEIRTPLTILKGNVNRIGDNELKQVLLSQSNKIQRIVSNVMDLTKMDTNEFTLNLDKINISEFIERIYLSFLSNFKNKQLNYELIDGTDKRIVVSADKIYLDSAVCNLIVNALKYTDDFGSITISISQESDNVCIQIIDTGIGIAGVELGKVFNRFYQSDNSINKSGGSGVGLAFSSGIIKKHEGRVEVESKLGEGSIFTIILPMLSVQKQKEIFFESIGIKLPDNEVEKPLPDQTKTILVVDDHSEMSAFIVSCLQGYKVVEASNGEEGLQKLMSEKIDYIITDYMMPKMNGADFVYALRKKGFLIPVLVLTAKYDVKMEMLQLGVDDYLTKPFEEQELLLRVRNGLRNDASRKAFVSETEVSLEDRIKQDISTKFLSDLTQYIEDNCTKEDFGNDALFEHFTISQSTLFRRLKSLTGLGIKEYVTEVRVQKAHKLLQENSILTLKEVSYLVGFKNYMHFKKLYYDRLGKEVD